jgi:hypothetical protein
MCDITGVEDNQFIFEDKSYPVPVFNIYSDSAYQYLSEWPQYKQNYELLTSTNPNVWNKHISGVGHFSLTDLALTSPFITRILNGEKTTTDKRDALEAINQTSLEFFDYYLKNIGELN